MEKLNAREKVGIWCLMLIVRWMVPKRDMSDDMEKMFANVQHQVNCNL